MSSRTSNQAITQVAFLACLILAAIQIIHPVFYLDQYGDTRDLLFDPVSRQTSLLHHYDDHRKKRSFTSLPDQNERKKSSIIPLRELIDLDPEPTCPKGLMRVNDTMILSSSSSRKMDPDALFDYGRRKIPRIVHVTSKTRCMPPEFVSNLEKWKFGNNGRDVGSEQKRLEQHAFVFHNEAAMERLLSKDWDEFPQLHQALRCTKGGAGRADVWRALVLWEYGGIYTDIDNAPAKFDGRTISGDDEAFFVIEKSAILSQYFFAASPRHPLFYLLVQHMMSRLLSLNDVSMQIVSVVTGPGALRVAFSNFMNGQGANIPYNKPDKKYYYPSAQTYVGMYNYSVTVVGHEDDPNEYVARDVIPDKNLIYKRMNMTYFRDIPKVESKQSCFQRIYKEESLFDEASKWFAATDNNGNKTITSTAYS